MKKLIVKSIICGIAVTVLAIFTSVLAGNKIVSSILLSPLFILNHLMGPHPVLGYDAQGNPMYEGTPIDGIVILFGLFLCIPFYSIISFLIFLAINQKKKTIS